MEGRGSKEIEKDKLGGKKESRKEGPDEKERENGRKTRGREREGRKVS